MGLRVRSLTNTPHGICFQILAFLYLQTDTYSNHFFPPPLLLPYSKPYSCLPFDAIVLFLRSWLQTLQFFLNIHSSTPEPSVSYHLIRSKSYCSISTVTFRWLLSDSLFSELFSYSAHSCVYALSFNSLQINSVSCCISETTSSSTTTTTKILILDFIVYVACAWNVLFPVAPRTDPLIPFRSLLKCCLSEDLLHSHG